MGVKRLSDLGTTFRMPSSTIDGLDVEEVARAVGAAVAGIRSGEGPAFIEATSVRLRSHSTTARETRTREELEALQERCPIAALALRMDVSKDRLADLQREADDAAAAALAFAETSGFPEPQSVLAHVG
jgi:pyruvate dehydrogenase E1 component alpha subunit